MNTFYSDFASHYGYQPCISCGERTPEDFVFTNEVLDDSLESTLSIYACVNCGTAYTFPFIDKSREVFLYSDYLCHSAEEIDSQRKIFSVYKIIEKRLNSIFFSNSNATLRKLVSGFLAQRLFQSYPIYFTPAEVSTPYILDIGCGDGSFLRKARYHGWACYGTEFNNDMIEKLRMEGIEMSRSLDAFVGTYFDVIRMNQVLEHVDAPSTLLKKAKNKLGRSGTLIISVPNYRSIYRVFGKYYWLHLPYHKFHFTKKGLVQLLTRHGFKILHLKTKSVGIGAASVLRRFPSLPWIFRPLDICASFFLDLFKLGDTIEIHAALRESVVSSIPNTQEIDSDD